MHRVMATLVAVGILVGAAACGDEPPADGYNFVAAGDHYGEWELSAEYRDGVWTGCLRMNYDDDGPMCADPDDGIVVFEDWTGAVYGGVPEGATLLDGGEEAPLIDGRFFVALEGSDPSDYTLAE